MDRIPLDMGTNTLYKYLDAQGGLAMWSELPESYSDESINFYKDAVYNYVSQRYGRTA